MKLSMPVAAHIQPVENFIPKKWRKPEELPILMKNRLTIIKL